MNPLRGALLENLVVNDFLKFGANRGINQHIYFYRDKSQREVDVLRVASNGIEAYEIKSSKTWTRSFSNNLDYLKKVMGERLTQSMVLYDGDLENPQRDNGYINFRHLNSYLND